MHDGGNWNEGNAAGVSYSDMGQIGKEGRVGCRIGKEKRRAR